MQYAIKRRIRSCFFKLTFKLGCNCFFRKKFNQSDESFLEQKFAIETCTHAIDSYRDLSNQSIYVKNIGISGGGKTWSMIYCILYACSKGLTIVSAAIMYKRALQLGGIHFHQLFLIPIEENLIPHRNVELAILKLLKNMKKIEFLRSRCNFL